MTKVQKVKGEQASLMHGLALQQRMERVATLLETYAEDVDKAVYVLNSALGAGMSWEEIDTMVKRETAAGKCYVCCLEHYSFDGIF